MSSNRTRFIFLRPSASVLAIPLVLLVALPCAAQEEHVSDRAGTSFWVNGGTGISSTGFQSASLSLSFRRGASVLSLRGTSNSEVLFSREFSDIGVLYGPCIGSGKNLLSFGMGLGVVTGRYPTIPRGRNVFINLMSARPKLNMSGGIPMEVQAFWRPVSFLGVGLYGYANVNSEKLFAGVTLCVQARSGG